MKKFVTYFFEQNSLKDNFAIVLPNKFSQILNHFENSSSFVFEKIKSSNFLLLDQNR